MKKQHAAPTILKIAGAVFVAAGGEQTYLDLVQKQTRRGKNRDGLDCVAMKLQQSEPLKAEAA